MGVNPEQLEQQQLQNELDAEFEDTDTIDSVEALQQALAMLKKNSMLFNYLSDSTFCRNLTKREREIMAAQSNRIDDLLDELEPVAELYAEEE